MDFIGREALLKHKENGIQKKLCMLMVDTNDVDPEGNETIWFGGKVTRANITKYFEECEGYLLCTSH